MSERDAVVACARGKLGSAYVWGTHGPKTFDCSGLVGYCFEQGTGRSVGYGSVYQYGLGKSVKTPQAGDVGFYDTFGAAPGHNAIYTGKGSIIHAFNEQRGVIESDLPVENMGGANRFMGWRDLGFKEQGGTDDPPKPDPDVPWSPVVYDLRNDAHAILFDLKPWERDQLLTKRIENRNGKRPELIGLHVQWGNSRGSLRYWLGVAASSTVMVQTDGSILKIIPEQHGPWTEGDVKNPDTEAKWFMQQLGTDDPNPYVLSIEAEDNRTTKINPAQERTIVWLIRQWWAKYPWLADGTWQNRIHGHYQVNSVDRATCGLYAPHIESLLAGNTPAPQPTPGFTDLPAWLPPDFFRAAFPLADPKGAVTKRLISWIARSGKVPWFQGKIDVGNGRNLWRFDTLTLLSDGETVWLEGEAKEK